jgi:hypothetical protein
LRKCSVEIVRVISLGAVEVGVEQEEVEVEEEELVKEWALSWG